MKEIEIKYKNNIILYRFLAIMLVVLGHATFVFTDGWVFKMPENPAILVILCKYIYTFHMPAFISISGYLFHLTVVERENPISLKSYAKKKVKRLLVPMVFVLVLWVMPVKLVTGYYAELGYNSVTDAVIFALKTLDLGHLWYLPVLFVLDMLMFISYKMVEDKIVESKKKTAVLMSILGIISIFYYLSDMFLPYLFGKFFKLAFFYLLGFLIRHWERKKEISYNNIMLCLMAVIQLMLIVFKAYLSNRIILNNQFTDFLVFFANFLVGYVSVHLLFGLVEKFQFFAEYKPVRYFSEKSMDIYLFHEPFIYIVIVCCNTWNFSEPYIFVVIAFVLSIVVSLLLSKILRVFHFGCLIGDKKNVKFKV